MRLPITILAATLLSACGVFSSGPTAPGELPSGREALWRTGHEAMRADSFRVAMAAFQRLATDYPRTGEGREARFYLGALYLDPANTAFDPALAAQNLGMFVADDSLRGGRAPRRPEAGGLLVLAQQLAKPCADRAGALKCEPQIVERPGGPAPSGGGDNGSAAEAARLRRELAERDATIRQLREELQRIRNTLAPRPD